MGSHSSNAAARNYTDAPEAQLVVLDAEVSINITKANSRDTTTSSDNQALSAEELTTVFTIAEGLVETVRNLPVELKKLMGFYIQESDGSRASENHRTKLFVSLNDTRLEADGTESALNEIILEIEIPIENRSPQPLS
jgi:hypothetical protein